MKRWKTFWFAGVLLVVAFVMRERLERIAANAVYLLSGRAEQHQQFALALWWNELAIRSGIAQAVNHDQMAMIYTQLGKPSQQVYHAQQTVDAKNQTATTLNNLAVTRILHSNDADANMLLQQAFALAPNNAILRYNLGMSYLRQGDYKRAEQFFREATYMNESWELPYLQLAVSTLLQKKYELAEQAANHAIELAPTQKILHLTLIEALSHQPNKQAVFQQAIVRALDYFPDDQTLQFYNALALRDGGKPEDALARMGQLYGSTRDPMLHDRLAKEIHYLLLQ